MMGQVTRVRATRKALFCCFILQMLLLSAVAQAQQSSTSQRPNLSPLKSQSGNSSSEQNGVAPSAIFGTVLDEGGAAAVGAQVRLTRPDQAKAEQVLSGDNGQFAFRDLLPGDFLLTIAAPGFEAGTFAGQLQAGRTFLAPVVVLKVTPATTTVNVGLTAQQIAQVEIKQQEKQRVLGIVPNFYVSYIPDAAPMNAKQKLQLAWRAVTDPVSIAGVGALAGIQQATNDYGGLGQEAGGYGKRFTSAYATLLTGTLIDDVLLASLMKQDPRYFYQGTGTTGSRLRHALEHAIMRKGDNGNWQPNYSGILGSFVNSGLSSLYYPEIDRSSGLVIQNALVGIAGRAVGGVFQEFVLRKFTSHADRQTSNLP
ncbi:MAG: carboxypeptidase-like regulatory domain-containing protein [Candidatus Korobacteraceae bacterium]